MTKSSFLPWSQLMAFGLGKLKLSPQMFWAMSLSEMDAAIEGYLGKFGKTPSPSRTNIDQLMADYPDKKVKNPDE